MKKEYLKPEIEVVELASESIAVTNTSVQGLNAIQTLSFKNNIVTY